MIYGTTSDRLALRTQRIQPALGAGHAARATRASVCRFCPVCCLPACLPNMPANVRGTSSLFEDITAASSTRRTPHFVSRRASGPRRGQAFVGQLNALQPIPVRDEKMPFHGNAFTRLKESRCRDVTYIHVHSLKNERCYCACRGLLLVCGVREAMKK